MEYSSLWITLTIALPVTVLIMAIVPNPAWSRRLIEEWAASGGFRVLAVEPAGWFDWPLGSKLQAAYRVRLVDGGGDECRCKVLVGHWLMGRLIPKIRFEWIQER